MTVSCGLYSFVLNGENMQTFEVPVSGLMTKRKSNHFLLPVLLMGIFLFTLKTSPAQDTLSRDQRMKWWRDARFGMFIHWGDYAVLGGVYKGHHINHGGEWIMNRAKIPVVEYQQYAKKFDPVKY